jgi:pentapeptide MXKDX repeat protein
MKKFTAVLLSTCMSLAVGSAFAHDATKKDAMAKDAMKK